MLLVWTSTAPPTVTPPPYYPGWEVWQDGIRRDIEEEEVSVLWAYWLMMTGESD